jgi:hypothetical protein
MAAETITAIFTALGTIVALFAGYVAWKSKQAAWHSAIMTEKTAVIAEKSAIAAEKAANAAEKSVIVAENSTEITDKYGKAQIYAGLWDEYGAPERYKVMNRLRKHVGTDDEQIKEDARYLMNFYHRVFLYHKAGIIDDEMLIRLTSASGFRVLRKKAFPIMRREYERMKEDDADDVLSESEKEKREAWVAELYKTRIALRQPQRV